jgi:hypothetical protein
MKPILITSFLFCLIFSGQIAGFCQENDTIEIVQMDQSNQILFLESEFTTAYLWRGLVLSQGTGFQTSAGIQYNNWSFGAWTFIRITANDARELDFYIAYDYQNFTFALNDYFYAADSQIPAYFDYKNTTTAHVIEFTTNYHGSERFPFRAMAGINLFGDDSYSTYWEAAWMHQHKNFQTEVFAGFTPQTGYYHADKKGFTNIGVSICAAIPEARHLFPNITMAISYNPILGKMHYVATIILSQL